MPDPQDPSAPNMPATRIEGEEPSASPSDHRLQPGGAHGARVDPGMSSLDRDIPPSGGQNFGQQDIGATRNDKS
jgi:hypothetical protein